MNTDISEEAKQAIPNGHLVRARQRLVRDGWRTDAAMRRRLLALAAERNLPPAEYAKLMHKRIMMRSIQEFCKKHNVSLDLADGRRPQGLEADSGRDRARGVAAVASSRSGYH